jgi:hypothetical protein
MCMCVRSCFFSFTSIEETGFFPICGVLSVCSTMINYFHAILSMVRHIRLVSIAYFVWCYRGSIYIKNHCAKDNYWGWSRSFHWVDYQNKSTFWVYRQGICYYGIFVGSNCALSHGIISFRCVLAFIIGMFYYILPYVEWNLLLQDVIGYTPNQNWWFLSDKCSY